MADTAYSSSLQPVTIEASDGIARVFTDTPLTKLNYFDGRYLRARDMDREQRYHEALSEIVAGAGGAGVVYGLGLGMPDMTGGPITVQPGIAIARDGRVVVLPGAITEDITRLIDTTNGTQASPVNSQDSHPHSAFAPCVLAETPTVETVDAAEPIYVITVAPVQALCGREDIYARLCEAACVTDSAANLRITGVILRARPLSLALPSIAGTTDDHLRSKLASAYFARETAARNSLLVSGGLLRHDWCDAASYAGGSEVPIGIVMLRNKQWIVLDQWTARRERMIEPPLAYWQGRLAMRPMDAFLAEVLQFQCQLADILEISASADEEAELLGETGDALSAAFSVIEKLQPTASASRVKKAAFSELTEQLSLARKLTSFRPSSRALKLRRFGSAGANELFRRGFVELPSAGFLPVSPKDPKDVRRQMASLLGPGIDFELIVAPADVIPHAFEEARDMRRIPLRRDPPAEGEERPALEIFVPDGQWSRTAKRSVIATHAALYDSEFFRCLMMLIDVHVRPSALGAALAHWRLQERRLDLTLISNRSVADANTEVGNFAPELVDTLMEQVFAAGRIEGFDMEGPERLVLEASVESLQSKSSATVRTPTLAFKAALWFPTSDGGAVRKVDARLTPMASDSFEQYGFRIDHQMISCAAKLSLEQTGDGEETSRRSMLIEVANCRTMNGDLTELLLMFRFETDGEIPPELGAGVMFRVTWAEDNLVGYAAIPFGAGSRLDDLLKQTLPQKEHPLNGRSVPIDFAGALPVSRKAAADTAELVAAACAALDPQLRQRLAKIVRVEEGDPLVTALRDWAMFRRSRKVVRESDMAAPPPVPPVPPEPEEPVDELTYRGLYVAKEWFGVDDFEGMDPARQHEILNSTDNLLIGAGVPATNALVHFTSRNALRQWRQDIPFQPFLVLIAEEAFTDELKQEAYDVAKAIIEAAGFEIDIRVALVEDKVLDGDAVGLVLIREG